MGRQVGNTMKPVGRDARGSALHLTLPAVSPERSFSRRSSSLFSPSVLSARHTKIEIDAGAVVATGMAQTCLMSAQLGARRGVIEARKTGPETGRAQEIQPNGKRRADSGKGFPGGEPEKHGYADF